MEINRVDKIARRSKRVGGAIADLWAATCVGVYYMVWYGMVDMPVTDTWPPKRPGPASDRTWWYGMVHVVDGRLMA